MTITIRSVPQGAAIKFKSVEQGIRLRPSTIPTLKLRATSKLPGPANVLSIGTVTDGVTADATITGSSPSQVLNLVLPKGDKGDTGSTGPQGTKGDDGDQGPTGATGPANSLSIGTVEDGPAADATITGTAPTQTLNLVLPKGDQGDPGDAATIAVGTVTTVDPTDPATVTNVGTSAAAVFNFEIPKGADGAGAVDSVNGQTGTVVLDPDDLDDTSTTHKFTTASDISKLAAIEANADVTDAANVGAAGAFMKSSDDADDVTEGASHLFLTGSERSAIAGLGSTYQPLDSDLTAIAGLSPTNDDIVQRKAGAWANRTMAQLATDLGLAANYQPLDSDLTSWAGVTRASGYDTFAATPSSANLRSLLTDESGTGAAVFANGPTLTAPLISQVVFPATQVPSSDPNTLDDYEEGTWTPVMTFATPGNLSVTHSRQDGYYTKIGRMVFLNYDVAASAFTYTSSSGNFNVSGVPIAPADPGPVNRGTCRWSNITITGFTQVNTEIVNGQTVLTMGKYGSGQSGSNLTTSDMPTAGTYRFAGSIQYNV